MAYHKIWDGNYGADRFTDAGRTLFNQYEYSSDPSTQFLVLENYL